ncbi:IF2 family translation initiation factor [Mycobacterium gordonae]|uniref:IF2 family translation initiation factor n=1 Tax=Mycobacterium gordonae TaxID=1778 RepID=A0A1X1WDP3_MYCGO|nr:IF2 family translation initiation factor [Mycobacterium gordonae]MCV7007268.1 IF2 family translation initiation factor [Mycobacterium gordonae]ODR23766.1 IF2 family translation initiation factor [Mycobacterium gordonae]ORV84668.1 IF2 family translation initiation factor [Mycobacterium gordonae]
MTISEMPFALLRFQYQCARYPLQFVEDRFVTRIRSEAPARLFYERALGVLDTTVGNVLRDPELVRRGTALVERTDALGRAAALDARATTRKEQADAKLDEAREQAVEDQKEARAATVQQIDEARSAADERKREATKSARQRSESAKKRVESIAANRKQAAESARDRVADRTKAVEKVASRAAESKLQDAGEKRTEAAIKRSQADRVEDLAEAEKQKRQSERASGSS